MAKHMIPVAVEAKDAIELMQVTQALNIFLHKVQPNELIKFYQAIQKNPGLIKTALKFV